MGTLFECYSELSESYYGIPIDASKFFAGEHAKLECRDFINRHFEKGEKKGVFDINREFANEYERSGKHQHTVSLYLMGLYLRRLFSPTLKAVLLEILEDIDEWYDFRYSWYLTCLYHDVASCVERNTEYANLVDAVENSALFTHQPIKAEAQFMRFPKELIMKYLRYREGQNRNEHSIIGGTQLFDKLSYSFNQKTANYDWSISPVYSERHLNWRRSHLDHFAYIADAVCCHNIWMVRKDDKEKCREYEEAGLWALIVRTQRDKINLSTFPLQFILCLLDTIEPIKKFRNIDAETVLKNIHLEPSYNGIKLAWTSIIKDQPEIYDWLNSLKSLSDWMDVSVGSCKHEGDLGSIEVTWPRYQRKTTFER